MNQLSLASKEFWKDKNGALPLKKLDNSHVILKLLEKYVRASTGKCIEIGCFPGQFLTFFGDKGYQLNGVDTIPRTEEIPDWLNALGYDVGHFYLQDFFDFSPEEKYYIVSSFGFIEHFQVWEDILLRHIDLVDSKGLLIVICPNFSGFIQKIFHRFLDQKNYSRHCVAAMNPFLWEQITLQRGFTTEFCGYFGRFDMWANYQKRNLFAKLLVHGIVDIIVPILKWAKLPDGKKSYAPFCGLIARKRT